MLLKKRTKSLTEFTAKLLTVLFSSFELWFKQEWLFIRNFFNIYIARFVLLVFLNRLLEKIYDGVYTFVFETVLVFRTYLFLLKL